MIWALPIPLPSLAASLAFTHTHPSLAVVLNIQRDIENNIIKPRVLTNQFNKENFSNTIEGLVVLKYVHKMLHTPSFIRWRLFPSTFECGLGLVTASDKETVVEVMFEARSQKGRS